MKSNTLRIVEDELPQVFDRRGQLEKWPDGVTVLRGDIVDPLHDTLQADLLDPNAVSSDEVDLTLDPDSAVRGRLREVHAELSDIFGPADFPGGLVRPPDDTFSPPTDCYAFYLPWHHVSEKLWGIYLLVEGVEALGRELQIFSGGALSSVEAQQVARIFLFHHEAYHNAVETFGARLEVTHRAKCYIGGFRKLYRDFKFHSGHEEAFANAYGALKVESHAFASVVPSRRRTQLRQHAVTALCKLFERQPPPYNDATRVLQDFDYLEWNFQERLHQSCFPQLPALEQEIWSAFQHALHPSLSRNGAFSYVIHSLHPYARSRAGVFYFDRRKFLQRLTSERPGQLVSGGKHPKWVTPDGLKVPIPTGELAHGTARTILKNLGVLSRYGSVERFMTGMRVG